MASKISIIILILIFPLFVFGNPDSTGIGLTYEKWAYNPYFSKVNQTNVGFGKRLTFSGATITANGDSINVDLNGVFWKQNGNSFGAESDFGSNDAFGVNLETNNTRRLRISSGGRLFSGTLTDARFSVSDTFSVDANSLYIVTGE